MADQGSKDILVVDDEADACQLAKLALEPEGYRVTVAHDVASANKALDGTTKFAAVLIDHHMPGGKGTAIADRLLKEISTSRIFYVTADDSQSGTGNVIQYLRKPYDPRTLLLMLDRALKTPREPSTAMF